MADYLSSLPVELIHKILDDISMVDILTFLCFVNKRLRAISLLYPRFHVDFRRTNTKNKFDFVCAQLPRVSSQIISLTLSRWDDVTTSWKITLFFSRFTTIHDTFPKLRSLTLTHIDYQAWPLIKSPLLSLSSLVSLSVDFIDLHYVKPPFFTSMDLVALLLFSPSLKRLSLTTRCNPRGIFNLKPLSLTTMSSIEYLHLDDEIDLLALLLITPALRTLHTAIAWHYTFKNTYTGRPETLQRLQLHIVSATMLPLERLLRQMIGLRHFVVVSEYAQLDVIDGDVWAAILGKIVTFEFVFVLNQILLPYKRLPDKHVNLDSFRSPFWLEKKKWYVTYDRSTESALELLYSNPYCDLYYPWDPLQDNIITESTGPLPTSFPLIEELSVQWQEPVNDALLRRYTHVTQVSIVVDTINLNIAVDYFTKYMDASVITKLYIEQWERETPINHMVEFIQAMPNVYTIGVPVDLLQLILMHSWPNITYLIIRRPRFDPSALVTSTDVDLLCRSFYRIDALAVSHHNISDLPHLLNTVMVKVSHILIEQHCDASPARDLQFITPEWLKSHTKLSGFHYSCNEDKIVTLWL